MYSRACLLVSVKVTFVRGKSWDKIYVCYYVDFFPE